MKILFLSVGSSFGGAEIVLADFLSRFNYFEYELLCHPKAKALFVENGIKESKIKTSTHLGVFSKKKNMPKFLYHFILGVLFISKRINKDCIVYGNNTQSVKFLFFFGVFKFKTVAHIHDILNYNFYNKLKYRLFNIFIAKFIFPSKSCMAKNTKLVDARKSFFLYNHYNNDLFINTNKIKTNKLIILFVGSFIKRKRCDFFLSIAKDIYIPGYDIQFSIIGRIDDYDYFQKQLKNIDNHPELKKKLNIYIDMKRCDVINELKNSQFLILTSDKDPLPTVIIEAMANSVVVVARNVDGVKEMIVDNYNGFLFNYDLAAKPAADYVNTILMSIINNKKAWCSLIEKGAATVSTKFSYQQKETEFLNIMKRL